MNVRLLAFAGLLAACSSSTHAPPPEAPAPAPASSESAQTTPHVPGSEQPAAQSPVASAQSSPSPPGPEAPARAPLDLDATWTASPSCKQPGLANVQAAVSSNTAFALSLYRQLANQKGNLVFSPSSVTIALSMLLNGAQGDTAREVADVLEIRQSIAEHHAALAGLSKCYAKPTYDPYQFFTANRIFGAKDRKLQRGFTTALGQYAAPVELLDFRQASEPSRQHINRWVASKTHQHIKDLLPSDSITADTSAVIVSTLYFKGFWQRAFNRAETRTETFHAVSGDVQAPLMRLKKQFKYAAGDGVQLVELPYRGGRFAMTLVVPRSGDLPATMQSLDEAKLSSLIGKLRQETVSVYVPRFEIKPQAETSLVPALKALGMRRAFDHDEAEFGAMADMHYFLRDVYHQATVKVDELGTVAVAATALGYALSSVPREYTVRADRPFLFLIRDVHTGFILFMGQVVDPS